MYFVKAFKGKRGSPGFTSWMMENELECPSNDDHLLPEKLLKKYYS